MNDFFSAIILAVIQGITEWLPVSSSGHLVIFDKILGYEGGLLFEVALHFGTLMAVFVYFGKDIADIIGDLMRFKFRTENGQTGIKLIVASVPAGIFGYFAVSLFDSVFNNLMIISFGFGITGILLFIASMDFWEKREELSYWGALAVGFAQAVSIVPGISRSGATIASSIMLGLEPKKAARFSFLMSIPVIFGANILVIGSQRLPEGLIWATLVSFVVGLITMHVLFKVVLTEKKNLRWFAGYALLLALGLGAYLVFR